MALRAHLLFQLLIVALSVSIFSFSIKEKKKKLANFIIFSKLYQNKKLLNTIFRNFHNS